MAPKLLWPNIDSAEVLGEVKIEHTTLRCIGSLSWEAILFFLFCLLPQEGFNL